MNSGSDTPRTDAHLLLVNEGRVYETDGPTEELCRTLERDLARLTAENEALRKELDARKKAQPVAWVVPTDITSNGADAGGWIDARIDKDGEFTMPLYAAIKEGS